MSFGDSRHFGLTADRELVPDRDRLARYLVEELDQLTTALDATT